MAFYIVKTEKRFIANEVSICVKNKETALAVAKFVCQVKHGSCKSYDNNGCVARYNRDDIEENEAAWGEVIVTEFEVVG